MDPNGYLVNWTWDFGDGATSHQRNPHHSYHDFQTQTVTLTVEDNDGYINNHTRALIMRKLYTNTTRMGSQTTINLIDQAHLLLRITTTQPTTVYTSVFSGNPVAASYPEGISAAGYYLDVSIDNEHVVQWPLNISLFYTQEDLDTAGLAEEQLTGMYYWNTSEQSWIRYTNTGVNISNQQGYEGYCWVQATHLTHLSLAGDTLPPIIHEDHTPASGTTGDNLPINLTVTDNVAITSAILWINNQSYAMEQNGDEYTYTVLVPSNSTKDILYWCTFSDAGHNMVTTTPKHIPVVDNDPPCISTVNHTLTLGNYTMSLNISCRITDNIDVETVLVSLHGPHHTSTYTPVCSGNDTYWYNASLSLSGIYNYTIIATDGSNNSNQTTPRNVTVELPNRPPGEPKDPFPVNGSTNLSLHPFLSWTCEDPDEDTLFFDVFFGNHSPPPQVATNHTHIYYDTGNLNASTLYFWQIQAKDTKGAITKGQLWQFTTGNVTENHPPDPPELLTPQNGTMTVNTSPILSVFVSDPDNDSLVVSFYQGNTYTLLGTTLVTGNSTTSMIWGDLPFNTTHSWYVLVNDSLQETLSNIWSFNTPGQDDQNETGDDNSDDDGEDPSDHDENPSDDTNDNGNGQPMGPGTTPNDEPLVPQNTLPIATAQVSDTEAFVGIVLIFNASESYDPDGDITQWLWAFDDGTTGEGTVVQHAYTHPGTYHVLLEVTDNEGASASDELVITIVQPNRPPDAPVLNGSLQANQRIPASYVIQATDPDGDALMYIIDWGDTSNQTTTIAYPENSSVTITHTWTSPGYFTLHLKASDGYTESPTTTVRISVDVHDLSDLGILIDSDSDGIYDLFSPHNGTDEIPVLRDEHGIYSLDIDNDNIPDMLYDPETDHVYSYSGDEDTPESSKEAAPPFITFIFLSGGAILLVTLLVAYRFKQRAKVPRPRRRKPPTTYRSSVPSKPRDLQLWGKRSTKLPKKKRRPRKILIWKHRLKSFLQHKHRPHPSRKKPPNTRPLLGNINRKRPRKLRKQTLSFSHRPKPLFRNTTFSRPRSQRKDTLPPSKESKGGPWQKHSSWQYYQPPSPGMFSFTQSASSHSVNSKPGTKKNPFSKRLLSKRTSKKPRISHVSPEGRPPKPHALFKKKHRLPRRLDTHQKIIPATVTKNLHRSSVRRTPASFSVQSFQQKHQHNRHSLIKKRKGKISFNSAKPSSPRAPFRSSKTPSVNSSRPFKNNKHQQLDNPTYKPSARRRQDTLHSNKINEYHR